MKCEDFLKKPYSERQFIVVVDDVIFEAEQKAKSSTEDKKIDYGRIAEIIIKDIFKSPLPFLIAKATENIVKSLFNLREKGINVLSVPRSASSGILFPPGHPRNQVLYVGHPLIPEVYYTVSEFHRKTFEHKFSEAIKLLMSLGAKQIEVEHVTGWSNEFAAKVNGGIPPAEISSEFEISNGKNDKILFKANFKNDSCCLPENLVWLDHEPNWQQIADGRLNYGLTDFSLLIHYEDDFGVNFGLKTNAEKAGFDLGGQFEEHKSTVWKIQGKFE